MPTRSKVVIGVVVSVLVISGAAIGILVASGGSSGAKAAGTSTSSAATTLPASTAPPPPIAPLTGLPDPTGESQTRPALSVKVENYRPDARPQAGIDQADVVYEEEVEGNITRFVAIFNSTAPETIGPVRSVRLEDPDIVWPIHGIFAYSGGAADPVAAINAAPVHAVDNTAAVANGLNGMERDAPGQPPRQAPHNLYAHAPALFSLGGDPKPPPPLFQYAEPGASPEPGADPGEPVESMRIGWLADYDASYTWDPASGTWKRFQHGDPHLVVGGNQIAPTNVVVQFTQYSDVSDAQTVGEGDAWVFTGGRVYKGRWVRPDREQPARYVDANGHPILLQPGRTWVELLPAQYAVDIVSPAPPPTTVAPSTVPPASKPSTTTRKPKSS
ncbi:MAG TPA: DUF3048 domain-containing protein [Acidimicrobiia bacterium]|nr:DUF3048 domain-containing protein [Acidimicrobiia bacterium]